MATLDVTGSGTHTVRWVYDKDFSVDSLSDTGWVDQGPYKVRLMPQLTAVTTAQTSASTASATLALRLRRPAALTAIRPPAHPSHQRGRHLC